MARLEGSARHAHGHQKIGTLDHQGAGLQVEAVERVEPIGLGAVKCRKLAVGHLAIRCDRACRGLKQNRVGVDAITVSLDGSPSNIDDFMAALNQYGIVESQRTGLVALPKLDRAATASAAKSPKGKAS